MSFAMIIVMSGAEELYGKASSLRIPVLVIHGSEDPVLPFALGKALADTIPHARLVILEGAGHEIHKDDWGLVISEISAHTEEGAKRGMLTVPRWSLPR